MARSIGIDPGDRTVKVVEIDGSYRRARLVNVHTAHIGSVADDPLRPDAVADATREAMDLGMRGDITLGHPCREAVLRSLELPFKGRDAIKKVVKAEIEGEIYTHSVDEMIVDFHEIGTTAAGDTRVLVASVPKDGLRNQLTSLAAQSVEPEFVDLDTMALWRTAHWAGAFDDDPDAADGDSDDSDGDNELPAKVDPSADEGDAPRVTAVVDIGGRTVKVILVEGEQLVEMRVLRLGEAVVADHVARHYELPTEQAGEATRECLLSGSNTKLETMTVLPAPAEAEGASGLIEPDESEAKSESRSVTVEHREVDAAYTAYLQRLARELTRFLTASGMASRIGRVWVTGSASRGRGIREMLLAVFNMEPRELDVLANLQHDLDDEEAAELSPRLAVAVGLALGRMGGPEGFQLRQEDLALTRGFERIKFPLAIACMVALLTLFVHWNRRSIELKFLHLQIGQQHIDEKNPKAAIFHGHLNPLFASKWFSNPSYFSLKRNGKKYEFRELVAEVAATPMHKRVKVVHDRLKTVAKQKQKESGVYENVSLESGLAVLVRWAELMKGVEPQLGRYLVPRLDLTMKSPNRQLEFTVAFRGEDFRSRMSALKRAIDAEIGRADSPFMPPKRSGDDVRELPFADADEKGVAGAYFRITIAVKDAFDPFGLAGAMGTAEPPAALNSQLLAGTGMEGK